MLHYFFSIKYCKGMATQLQIVFLYFIFLKNFLVFNTKKFDCTIFNFALFINQSLKLFSDSLTVKYCQKKNNSHFFYKEYLLYCLFFQQNSFKIPHSIKSEIISSLHYSEVKIQTYKIDLDIINGKIYRKHRQISQIMKLFIQYNFGILYLTSMSANRLKNTKKKFEDVLKKDLTPKSTKVPTKISSAYSSFRGGLTLKPELHSKTKIVRPSTSKNSSESKNFFHSNNDQKSSYSSTKRFKKEQTIRKNETTKQYEYQPRSKSKSPLKQPDQIIRQQIECKYPANVSSDRDIRQYKNQHPVIPKILSNISNFEKAKHSSKASGFIRGYAASTNQGPVRQYNQDRVAIILAKPQHCIQWKKAGFFGVFDSHGGVDCADYLRDNLHLFITKQKSFPNEMEKALKIGFEKCEKTFIEQSKFQKVDRSGSCAVVTFFYGGQLYVANCGDSRTIMSSNFGEDIWELSIDHKASEFYEQKRIFDAGGRIYQTKLQNANPNIKLFYEGEEHTFILGPHRVAPGRLSVTRTFGDIEAKLPEFKGNQNVIINEPEIRKISLSSQHDFIILASDGIFDKMSNSEIIQIVWSTFKRDEGRFKNLHEFCGLAVENIMKLAFYNKTLDNITVVMVALEGLQKYFIKKFPNTIPDSHSFHQTMVPESRRQKITTKYQSSFQRRYIGRSTSPSNYSAIRSHSFYRN